MNKLPEPRQLALTLRSEGSAEANGEDTITLTATLTDGDSLVSGEVITFIATNGAFFPDGESSIISVTTNSQGKAVAGLACSTPGTFNVTALLARDSGVNASVSVVFGDGGSTGDLPAPAVDEAVNGRIPADTSTLTLRIPAWTGMAPGDHLTYYWHASAADGTGSTLQDGFKLVSTDIGKDVVFNLDPGVAVAPYDGGTADVWYAVTPNDGGPAKESDHASWLVGEAKPLPAPGVEEADGNNIDLAGLSDNVHVSLSWPSMAVNDVVTLFWQGTDGSGTAHPEQQAAQHRVTDNDVQDQRVRLPLSVAMYLTPYENGSVQSYYTLNRADGSDTAYSEKVTYALTAGTAAGDLWVAGARNSRVMSTGLAYSSLVALDKQTRQPVTATWRYEGDNTSLTGTRFNDVRPERVLVVQSGRNTVRLRPVNFSATGGSLEDNSYAVCLDTHQLFAWGEADSTAYPVPPYIASLHDIICVTRSGYAFAAQRTDGSVVAWGDSDYGGDASSVSTLRDIVSVTGNRYAFAALRADGSVVAWGDSYYGGDASSVATLRDIVSVTASASAFAALRADGSVVAWGDSYDGGDASSVATLRDIVSVAGSASAFAALRADGSVVAWGDSGYGGDASSVATLRDIVSVTGIEFAFAALRADGSVVAWGNSGSGGDASSVATVRDIVSVAGSASAFAALRADGSVVAWGDSYYGGDASSVATVRDIVSVTGNSSAFAALRADGSVVAWGDRDFGGNLPAEIAELRDIRAVYKVPDGFIALTDDSHLYKWGYITVAIPNAVQGLVSYLL